MCMRSFMTDDIGFMSWETYTAIFNDTVPISIKLNWRGEPTMHQAIVRMVAYAKEKGVHEVSINTNGQLLTPMMIEELSKVGLDWLIFSCDGATKSTYESIRKGGNFELLVKNIIYCAWRFDGKLRIQICKQKANEHEIDKWRELFKPYAAELRIGNLFDPQGKRGYNQPLPKTCGALWRRLSISWKGDIFPCPSDFEGHWKLGNIKTTSINKAWHSSRLNYHRYTLAKYGRAGSSYCSKCTAYC